MDTYIETRYFTKSMLLEAIDAAIRENRSRVIPKDLIINSPDEFIFVVHKALYHNKNEMRLMITIDFTGKPYLLDVGMTRFHALPISKTYPDGNIILESPEVTKQKRPYGEGREFEEKLQTKPIRKSTFRKTVIEAYEGQCALCTIKDPVVAAHIVPVANGGADTIQNGILLCKNHDHLFEHGKIKISPSGNIDYDSENACNVTKIRYPVNVDHYPAPENFRKKLELVRK